MWGRTLIKSLYYLSANEKILLTKNKTTNALRDIRNFVKE